MLLHRWRIRLGKDHHPPGNHGVPPGPGRRGGDWRPEQQAGGRRKDQGQDAPRTPDGLPGPPGALDPRFTVYEVLAEPLQNAGMDRTAIKKRIMELMKLVG